MYCKIQSFLNIKLKQLYYEPFQGTILQQIENHGKIRYNQSLTGYKYAQKEINKDVDGDDAKANTQSWSSLQYIWWTML